MTAAIDRLAGHLAAAKTRQFGGSRLPVGDSVYESPGHESFGLQGPRRMLHPADRHSALARVRQRRAERQPDAIDENRWMDQAHQGGSSSSQPSASCSSRRPPPMSNDNEDREHKKFKQLQEEITRHIKASEADAEWIQAADDVQQQIPTQTRNIRRISQDNSDHSQQIQATPATPSRKDMNSISCKVESPTSAAHVSLQQKMRLRSSARAEVTLAIPEAVTPLPRFTVETCDDGCLTKQDGAPCAQGVLKPDPKVTSALTSGAKTLSQSTGGTRDDSSKFECSDTGVKVCSEKVSPANAKVPLATAEHTLGSQHLQKELISWEALLLGDDVEDTEAVESTPSRPAGNQKMPIGQEQSERHGGTCGSTVLAAERERSASGRDIKVEGAKVQDEPRSHYESTGEDGACTARMQSWAHGSSQRDVLNEIHVGQDYVTNQMDMDKVSNGIFPATSWQSNPCIAMKESIQEHGPHVSEKELHSNDLISLTSKTCSDGASVRTEECDTSLHRQTSERQPHNVTVKDHKHIPSGSSDIHHVMLTPTPVESLRRSENIMQDWHLTTPSSNHRKEITADDQSSADMNKGGDNNLMEEINHRAVDGQRPGDMDREGDGGLHENQDTQGGSERAIQTCKADASPSVATPRSDIQVLDTSHMRAAPARTPDNQNTCGILRQECHQDSTDAVAEHIRLPAAREQAQHYCLQRGTTFSHDSKGHAGTNQMQIHKDVTEDILPGTCTPHSKIQHGEDMNSKGAQQPCGRTQVSVSSKIADDPSKLTSADSGVSRASTAATITHRDKTDKDDFTKDDITEASKSAKDSPEQGQLSTPTICENEDAGSNSLLTQRSEAALAVLRKRQSARSAVRGQVITLEPQARQTLQASRQKTPRAEYDASAVAKPMAVAGSRCDSRKENEVHELPAVGLASTVLSRSGHAGPSESQSEPTSTRGGVQQLPSPAQPVNAGPQGFQHDAVHGLVSNDTRLNCDLSSKASHGAAAANLKTSDEEPQSVLQHQDIHHIASCEALCQKDSRKLDLPSTTPKSIAYCGSVVPASTAETEIENPLQPELCNNCETTALELPSDATSNPVDGSELCSKSSEPDSVSTASIAFCSPKAVESHEEMQHDICMNAEATRLQTPSKMAPSPAPWLTLNGISVELGSSPTALSCNGSCRPEGGEPKLGSRNADILDHGDCLHRGATRPKSSSKTSTGNTFADPAGMLDKGDTDHRFMLNGDGIQLYYGATASSSIASHSPQAPEIKSGNGDQDVSGNQVCLNASKVEPTIECLLHRPRQPNMGQVRHDEGVCYAEAIVGTPLYAEARHDPKLASVTGVAGGIGGTQMRGFSGSPVGSEHMDTAVEEQDEEHLSADAFLEQVVAGDDWLRVALINAGNIDMPQSSNCCASACAKIPQAHPSQAYLPECTATDSTQSVACSQIQQEPVKHQTGDRKVNFSASAVVQEMASRATLRIQTAIKRYNARMACIEKMESQSRTDEVKTNMILHSAGPPQVEDAPEQRENTNCRSAAVLQAAHSLVALRCQQHRELECAAAVCIQAAWRGHVTRCGSLHAVADRHSAGSQSNSRQTRTGSIHRGRTSSPGNKCAHRARKISAEPKMKAAPSKGKTKSNSEVCDLSHSNRKVTPCDPGARMEPSHMQSQPTVKSFRGPKDLPKRHDTSPPPPKPTPRRQTSTTRRRQNISELLQQQVQKTPPNELPRLTPRAPDTSYANRSSSVPPCTAKQSCRSLRDESAHSADARTGVDKAAEKLPQAIRAHAPRGQRTPRTGCSSKTAAIYNSAARSAAAIPSFASPRRSWG